jgi:hypothetical protein
MEFSARYVFIGAPPSETTEIQLKEKGLSDAEVQGILKAVKEDAEHSITEKFYDLTLPSSVDEAMAMLEEFVLGPRSDLALNSKAEPEEVPGPLSEEAGS